MITKSKHSLRGRKEERRFVKLYIALGTGDAESRACARDRESAETVRKCTSLNSDSSRIFTELFCLPRYRTSTVQYTKEKVSQVNALLFSQPLASVGPDSPQSATCVARGPRRYAPQRRSG